MKLNNFLLLLVTFMLAACAGQRNRVILIPDPAELQQEQNDPFELWQIIESKGGPGDAGIPGWIRLYYNDKNHGLESLDQYYGRYIFAGENRGDNFNALNQWANGFTAEYDLPRLVAARVERRLVSSASLYPDDEYGQYFESLIKKISDGEYPGAVKEQIFWIKRNVIERDEERDADDELAEVIVERYEFLVILSIDREIMQQQLREIMSDIKTSVPPTRDQNARINRIRQTFFEGF
jgi:hypothetical protein